MNTKPESNLDTWCHVHNGLWRRAPGFISTPLVKNLSGSNYPVMACKNCSKDPVIVREAYLRFTGQ